jgi:acyl dehydratase
MTTQPRPADPGRWWLEDAVPGTTLHHPRGRTVGPDEHVWLAWVTNNASDVHGNADRAGRGEFGGVVVLGALTAAIVVGLAEPASWPIEEVRKGLPEGWSSIALRGAVRPGDTLHAASQILGIRVTADHRGGFVRRRIIGSNQRGETVVVVTEQRLVPSFETLNKGLLTTGSATA